jgi:phosphoenolpyruvate synthase/pyruvate phosphate dikinase
MFCIDTETGFRDAVLLTAAYGLGETVVQGSVNPDEYLNFKPTLEQGFAPILSRRLGSKAIRMVYAPGAVASTHRTGAGPGPEPLAAPAPGQSVPSQNVQSQTDQSQTDQSQTDQSQTVQSQTVPSQIFQSQTVPSQIFQSQNDPCEQLGLSHTCTLAVDPADRARFAITDDEVLQLARWACRIEAHYSARRGKATPMDIEWAKDGLTGELFILQARPETVESRRSAQVLRSWHLEPHQAPVITRGRAIGASICTGRARIIQDPSAIASFQ